MRSIVHFAGLSAIAVLSLALIGVEGARAQKTQPRQYYSRTWTYNKATSYHYKEYHFKVKKTDTVYKKQVVVYKPTHSKHYVYWYNPDTKKYWARCPTVNHPTYGKDVQKGKDYWSIAHQDKRTDSIDDMKEDCYGKTEEKSPPVPQCDDGEKIQCPPTDLPRA